MVQQNEGTGRRRRVAIYCRVSTSDQDCDRQERDLIDYAKRAGFEVVEVFKETLSGIRKAKGKQPIERKKVMELAQAREIDAVLVTELTRWGRSTQDLMDTLGQLASWDVSLIAQTGLQFDLATPQGQAHRQPYGFSGGVRARPASREGPVRDRCRESAGTAVRPQAWLPALRQARPESFRALEERTFPAQDRRRAGAIQDHCQ